MSGRKRTAFRAEQTPPDLMRKLADADYSGLPEAASAIEARSDATPKSDAAEGESATHQGDAETPKP